MESYDSHGSTREAAQVLESRIASAAHAAHDVIESHLVDQLLAGTTLVGKSRSYFLLDLQRAIDNLDFIKTKAMFFKVKSGVRVATYSAHASLEPLTSGKNVMVGFDGVVVRLRETLTGEPSSGQRVIPIIGMGGIGKTTLARNVFDLSIHLFSKYFDVCLWATISQENSVENILNELLSQNSRNNSELGLELHKMLWSRRYLIVLDDMWSDGAWDEVQHFLPDNGNGSCIIVTTRLSNLAARLSSSPFEMDFLDDDQSWQLFRGKTFGEEDCPIELEEVGRKIVKRCRGLPLSIVVIGGHLKRSSRGVEYWETVANFMNPISDSGADDQCLKIISLSYDHLPTYLKPCFLYFGIVKENAFIDAPQLIRFWIAEGFVKGKKGVCLEELAEDYLNDLRDRNLIIVRERSWNGKVEYFVIHDIVRELCLKVAQQEKFLGVNTNVISERRIVVPMEFSSLQTHTVGADLELPSLLCSLMCHSHQVCFKDELWVNLKLLRLWGCVNHDFFTKNGKFFPTLNFQQVNLCYLPFNVDCGGLSYTYPILSSMSIFWNMQTLIISNEISMPMTFGR